jgi:hypothetical protein
MVRASAARSAELGEGHFDGIEVGAVRGQVAQARAGGLDRLSDAIDSCAGRLSMITMSRGRNSETSACST